jgi:hypothetical protein
VQNSAAWVTKQNFNTFIFQRFNKKGYAFFVLVFISDSILISPFLVFLMNVRNMDKKKHPHQSMMGCFIPFDYHK